MFFIFNRALFKIYGYLCDKKRRYSMHKRIVRMQLREEYLNMKTVPLGCRTTLTQQEEQQIKELGGVIPVFPLRNMRFLSI